MFKAQDKILTHVMSTIENYYKHKKRWRRFTGKAPRRFRRFNRFAGKHKAKWHSRGGKGSRGQYASFLPSNAFAGGKGVQRKPQFDKNKNPRGRDGKVLKCHGCGSENHLMRKCPNKKGGGKGGRPIFV